MGVARTLGRMLSKDQKTALWSAYLKARIFIDERRPWPLFMAAKLFPSRFAAEYRRRSFESIYRDQRWGSEEGSPFYSGVGSRGEVGRVYTERMSAILNRLEEREGPLTVVDLGCGDFAIGRELLRLVPTMRYIGCDIVPGLIAHHWDQVDDPRASFEVIDIVADPLPAGNVCLVRQVLQHLNNGDVAKVVAKLGVFSHVYVTEGQPVCPEGPPNPDKSVGSGVRFDYQTGRGRGLELHEPPFNCEAEELFRVDAAPVEQVVTYKVRC